LVAALHALVLAQTRDVSNKEFHMHKRTILLTGLTLLAASTGVVVRTEQTAATSQSVRPGEHAHLTHAVSPQASGPRSGVQLAVAGQGVTTTLPVVVDGAKDPQSIPDALAYRHFIRALAESARSANPTSLQVARRQALLARVGLSSDDRAAFIGALSGVDGQLAQVARARKQYSREAISAGTAREPLQTLRLQEGEILDATRGRLEGALSGEGVRRLQTHIQEQVKKRIVIYGDR
jgi:hypothetical protein